MLYSPMHVIQLKHFIETKLKGNNMMPSPEKFRQILDDFHVEPDLIDEMYQGFCQDGIKNKQENKDRLFHAGAGSDES